jgi:hypothetical protein
VIPSAMEPKMEKLTSTVKMLIICVCGSVAVIMYMLK